MKESFLPFPATLKARQEGNLGWGVARGYGESKSVGDV
ncbi:hypothetical protein MPNT_40054 [Candidatus Methylacidithermus pantelleriae]|uniref:Uncharacterized protein n=1 Tax=Candidatus Methylacidithermus pantelleriae TaxID=2744239 RepID=A0A8J2BR93_9BACT|nr:hypothetical protein MPNT_40054 [Candidatus Methylacidithermus pantelleriae]